MQDRVTASGPCVDTAEVLRSDQVNFESTFVGGDSDGCDKPNTTPTKDLPERRGGFYRSILVEADFLSNVIYS